MLVVVVLLFFQRAACSTCAEQKSQSAIDVLSLLHVKEPTIHQRGSFTQVPFENSVQLFSEKSSLVQQRVGHDTLLGVSIFCGVLIAFLIAGVCGPRLPKTAVSLLVMAFYVSLSVSIDLLIMSEKKTGAERQAYAFNPICAIIVTESLKLIFSVVLIVVDRASASQPYIGSVLTTHDVFLFALPAVFFTANNVMVFVAIGGTDAAAFGVFRDTMILWTALIWVLVFRAHLGMVRQVGIGVIFLGLVINRIGSLSHQTFSWGFLLVILMTVTNATGSVVNEYALKWNSGLDINIQNAVLYTMCIFFSGGLLVVTDPVRLSSGVAFLHGFSNHTIMMICLQAVAGLLVSRLLKYADAIFKTIGTCLRGPAIVVLAPAIFHTPQDLTSIAAAFVVASGCMMYLTQGPLSGAIQKPIQESKA